MWGVKLLIMLVFSLLFFQDYKERKVYWFLYPIVGILVFVLQTDRVPIPTALMNAAFNLVFVLCILTVCYIYARFRLKKSFFEALGIGDVLFFIFIAFSFSIISFFILFIFSLLFSLGLHLVVKNKQIKETVPLAGYMALFFGMVYGLSFFMDSYFLYAY